MVQNVISEDVKCQKKERTTVHSWH